MLPESFVEAPTWNFWKYLVDEAGKVVHAWGPWISVEDIFHDVKQAVDSVAHPKQSNKKSMHERTVSEEL